MKRYVLLTLVALLPHRAHAQPTQKIMMTGQPIYTAVYLTVQGDKLVIDLTVENRQAVDVYMPDVAFLSTKDGVKLNPEYLPVRLNKENNLEIDIRVKPLDPNKLWATPPTFYTHVIKPRVPYQRRWTIPYPVLIASQDNQGMGRMVPMSQDVLVNIGLVSPPASYQHKEIPIDGQTLYQFRYNALSYQTIYPQVLTNRNLKVSVNE